MIPALVLAFSGFVLWIIWGCALMALGFMRGISSPFEAPAFGGGGRVISSLPGSVAGSKEDWVDSVTREVDIAAVNTWTALTNYGATAAGAVQVPSKARYLSKIEISTAWDVTSTAAVYKLMSAIRLSGNGLVNGGIYKFLGQCGYHAQVNAFAAGSYHGVQTYLTRIPVSPSDSISIEGVMLAEDAGDITIAVTLHFSASDPGSGIVDADCRNNNITAVDTSTSMTTLAGDTLGVFKIPTNRNKIIGIVTAVAPDMAAGAAAQRCVAVAQLTGPALASGGNYMVQSGTYAYSAQGSAAWGQGGISDIHGVDLDVVPASELTVNAQMIGEDSGDIEMGVGILYG